MKKIALFPGTDAIENPQIRQKAFQSLMVQRKVKEAELILIQRTGRHLQLTKYMTGKNELSLDGFQKLVLCSLATQVAMFESFEKSGQQVDMLMGLSLGDIARSVAAGLCSFEEGLMLLYKFTELCHQIEEGATLQIRLDQPYTELKEQLQLEKFNLEISVMQNDCFFLVAGAKNNIKLWIAKVAVKQNIRFRILYPFPIHCKLMQPIARQLEQDIIKTCRPESQIYQIYSTVFAKELDGHLDFINDSVENIHSTLWFTDTIRNIQAKYKDVTFVNIGPAPTMLQFIRKMNLNAPGVKLINWFDEFIEKMEAQYLNNTYGFRLRLSNKGLGKI